MHVFDHGRIVNIRDRSKRQTDPARLGDTPGPVPCVFAVLTLHLPMSTNILQLGSRKNRSPRRIQNNHG